MRSFAVEKFRSLLVAGSFTIICGFITSLSDSIVAGNLIGEEALGGIAMCSPIVLAISFLSSLIGSGSATLYLLEMGRCQTRRAHEYLTQAVWTVLIFCGAFSLLIALFPSAYLSFFGAAPEIARHAAGYIRWVTLSPVLDALLLLMVGMCYADGETKLCIWAYVAVIAVNLLVSIGSVKLFAMGTAGCSLATVVANAVGLLVLCTHFLRKSNTLAFVRHFSWRDTFSIFGYSFGDAAAFLCDALLVFFLNKFMVWRFGSDILPVVGVATGLWGFLEIFNGVGVAAQPLVTAYYGEGNTKVVRSVMKSAMRIALAEGLALMLVFGVWPQLAARIFGLDDPTLLAQASQAVRLICIGFVPLAFAGLFNSYYMFIEKSVLAVVLTFIAYFVMPVAGLCGCADLGAHWIWLGLGLGPLLGLAVLSVLIVLIDGSQMFPLCLAKAREDNIFSYGLALEPEAIVAASRAVNEWLSSKGVGSRVVARAALMTEEVFMVVRDRNAGRRLLGEVTIDLNDGVRLTLRDDGEIFDITDADAQISSLRSFLVASVMQAQSRRLNLVTTGFNRNVFRF